MASMMPPTLVRFPQTLYGVALQYRKGDLTRLLSWMFQVSGEDPLTEDEACVRARKMVEAHHPDLSEWAFTQACASNVVQRRT